MDKMETKLWDGHKRPSFFDDWSKAIGTPFDMGDMQALRERHANPDTPTSEMGRLIDEVARLGRENEQLRGLLKRLESIMDELTDGTCRICGADMYEGSDGFRMNHAPDCALARAIGGTS